MYIEANVMLSFNILIMFFFLIFKVVSHNSYRIVPLFVTRLVYMLLILLNMEVRL